MSSGEHEELIREEIDANELKKLVSKEEESTSLEPNEMKKEFVKTFPKMNPWGEVFRELKNKK